MNNDNSRESKANGTLSHKKERNMSLKKMSENLVTQRSDFYEMKNPVQVPLMGNVNDY